MKHIWSIFKKEFKGYIDHPMAYILAIVFLIVNNYLFFKSVQFQPLATLRPMFSFLPWLLIFFTCALSMRTWSEEKKQGTLQVLISYPIKVWEIILGKYIATVVFVAIMLAITLIIPITLAGAGDFEGGVIFAQYLGALLMSMGMIAIGQWASSLTRNQVVAFIVSLAILFGFILVGLETVTIALTYPFNTIASQLGMLSHFNSMSRGVIDIRDILYFLSVAAIFLGLSYGWLMKLKQSPKSKEWKSLQTSIAVAIAIAVVINLFGQSFTVRADLTTSNLYSLSSVTKDVLASLDDTVRFTLYRSEKLPPQFDSLSRDVQDILADYQKFGGRQVDYKIIYPESSEDVQGTGIPAVQFNVYAENEFSAQEGYFGLQIQVLDQQETIPLIQSISDFEYQLTRAIVQMKLGSKPTLAYATGFGMQDLSESVLIEEIRKNYTVQAIDLQPEAQAVEGSSDVAVTPPATIGANVDVLAIIHPTEAFSEAAIATIQDYIDNGGEILWMVAGSNVQDQSLTASENSTGLEALLADQGITLSKDVAGDLQEGAQETLNFQTSFFPIPQQYPYWVRGSLQNHQLAGTIPYIVLPWPSTMKIAGIDDEERIKPLVKTSTFGIGQDLTASLNPFNAPDYSTMQQTERLLAATIEEIPAANTEDTGRWVVVSSGRVIQESLFANEQSLQQYQSNLVFFLNALDWLTQNDALLTIRSKQVQPNPLVWEEASSQSIAKWANVAGIPVLVALFGGVWLYRRSRKIKKELA